MLILMKLPAAINTPLPHACRPWRQSRISRITTAKSPASGSPPQRRRRRGGRRTPRRARLIRGRRGSGKCVVNPVILRSTPLPHRPAGLRSCSGSCPLRWLPRCDYFIHTEYNRRILLSVQTGRHMGMGSEATMPLRALNSELISPSHGNSQSGPPDSHAQGRQTAMHTAPAAVPSPLPV